MDTFDTHLTKNAEMANAPQPNLQGTVKHFKVSAECLQKNAILPECIIILFLLNGIAEPIASQCVSSRYGQWSVALRLSVS